MPRRVAVLAIATFAVGTDAYVIAGVLPDLARSLAVGVAQAGQLVTVFALAYAVLAPLITTLTGSWNRRRVLLAALAVFVVGNVWTALASNFVLVLLSRVVAAAGAAMVTPTCGVLAASLVPPRRRVWAIALVTSGLTAALALGAPAGTGLSSVLGWRGTMLFVAGLGLVALLVVAAVVPATPAPPPVGVVRRLAPVGDLGVLGLVATSLLAFSGVNVVYTYSSVVFARATGGDSRTLALLLVVFGGAATVGNLVIGRLADRVGAREVVAVACAVLAVVFLLVGLGAATTMAGAVLIVAVYGAASFSINAPQQHRLMAIRPDDAALVIALNATFVYLGVAAAGGLGGLVLGVAGPAWVAPAALVAVLLGLTASETAHRRERRRTPERRTSRRRPTRS